MRVISFQQAKTYFSRLIERAAAGEPLVIAKAGRLLVRVVPADSPEPAGQRRLGFLAGQGDVPDNFDQIGSKQIERMFAADA